MLYLLKIILLVALSFASYPMQGQGQDQWQEELTGTSQQVGYYAIFVITKNKTHILTVDARECQKFDTRCIWQYTRSWIGIALDKLNAQKATKEDNTPISGLQCTLVYSVYQEDPEKLWFRCQDGRSEKIHYTQLKEFLIEKFR